MEKCTTSGGRTREANERSFVFVHEHTDDDVTCKPPLESASIRAFLNIGAII